MARTPRARRLVAEDFNIEPQPASAVEEAMARDDATSDDTAAEIIDAISSVITNETRLMIYRVDPRSSKLAYVETIYPPIIVDKLLDTLKDTHGGGNYDLRIIGKQGVITRKQVAIEGQPLAKNQPVVQVDTSKDMFGMMMQMQQMQLAQQAEDRRLQEQHRAEDRREQAQQRANNTQMIIGLATVAIPAIIPLFNKPGGGVKEMIETMGAAKSLFDMGGGGDESFLTTAAKGILPMLADGMKNAQAAQQQAPQEQPQQLLTAQGTPYMPPAVFLDAGTSGPTPPYPLPNNVPDNPILRLVGPDVLFMFHRGFNPSLAAEAVADVLNNNGLGLNDVQPLALQFAASQDWVADLAGQGIDLTGNREWAEQFLAGLIQQLSEVGPADGTPAGEDGGASNT